LKRDLNKLTAIFRTQAYKTALLYQHHNFSSIAGQLRCMAYTLNTGYGVLKKLPSRVRQSIIAAFDVFINAQLSPDQSRVCTLNFNIGMLA
jgi:hypothetical protein